VEFRKSEIKARKKSVRKNTAIKGTPIAKAIKAVEEAKKNGLDLSYLK